MREWGGLGRRREEEVAKSAAAAKKVKENIDYESMGYKSLSKFIKTSRKADFLPKSLNSTLFLGQSDRLIIRDGVQKLPAPQKDLH